MHKLPVFATFGRALWFVIGDLPAIVRLSWFPLLLVTVANYFVGLQMLDLTISVFEKTAAGAPPDPFAILRHPAYTSSLAVALLQAVAVAIVTVALHRILLYGDRKPGTFIHFSFGKVELLFLLVPILLALAVVFFIFVVMIGLAVATGVGVSASGMSPEQLEQWMRGSPLVAGVLALLAVIVIYLAVRLHLVFPTMVVEQRMAISEAWDLTNGNFWRIVGLYILVFLFAVLIGICVAIGISTMAGINFVPPITEGPEAINRHQLALIKFERDNFVALTAIGYVLNMLIGAFGVGLLSYSYKALRGLGATDTIDMINTGESEA